MDGRNRVDMIRLVQWIGFVVGVITVGAVVSSIVTTLVVPRLLPSKISYGTWQTVHRAFMVITAKRPDYESKDRVLALLGPVSLLMLLGNWLLMSLLGYALLFWPFIDGSIGDALRLSGSSLVTLGIASDTHAVPTVLEVMAAATGLVIVALEIGYLPTIYSAYNRRESLVTVLAHRAGAPDVPVWGPEILARHHLAQGLATLPALYAAWEGWSADVAESHSSYPWLMAFRSPNPMRSWIVSLLAVLDSAALYLALAPARAPAEARQCLRGGFMGLRALSRITGGRYDEDPRPDGPLALTYQAFAEAVATLERLGFPLERSAAEAWPDFRGWRVNYEAVCYDLADYFVAVPAPWSGPRQHMSEMSVAAVLAARPRHRSPRDPAGQAALPVQAPSDSVVTGVTPPEQAHAKTVMSREDR